LRCSQCRRFTPGLWLNLYSLSLIVLLLAANWIHIQYMTPILVDFAAGLGLQLPLALRIYLGLSAWAMWGWVLIAVIVVLLLVRRKMPRFLLSGRLLAAAASVFLLYTLTGVFSGYMNILRVPSLVK
jgi:hypothetical protein